MFRQMKLHTQQMYTFDAEATKQLCQILDRPLQKLLLQIPEEYTNEIVNDFVIYYYVN